MQRRTLLKLGGLAAGGWLGAAGLAAVPGAVAGTRSGRGEPLPPLTAAQWQSERQWQPTRFGDIAYVERGSGPAALFLHGFPLNGFQWRGALERLAPLRRCLAPDLLGLGYTRVAAGQGVTPADQVQMLTAWLDALRIVQVDLVANDSGGAVAQLFAVQFPQRVRSLLLTNCDSEIDCPPPALQPVIDLARQGQFVAQWLAPWLADPVLARSPQGLGGKSFDEVRWHSAAHRALAMYDQRPDAPSAGERNSCCLAQPGVEQALGRLLTSGEVGDSGLGPRFGQSALPGGHDRPHGNIVGRDGLHVRNVASQR